MKHLSSRFVKVHGHLDVEARPFFQVELFHVPGLGSVAKKPNHRPHGNQGRPGRAIMTGYIDNLTGQP